MKPLDAIDRRLLTLVQRDAKLSYAELGAKVGLSVSSIMERLRRLQKSGVIRGFHAVLDPAALELRLTAYVQVAIDRPENEPPFLRQVVAVPEIAEVHHITGEFSYLLKIRARDTAHLEELLVTAVKRLRGITRTHTLVVLSTAKETAEVPTGAALVPSRRKS